MSSMMRTEERAWLPIAIGAAALLAAVIALGVVKTISDRPAGTRVVDRAPAAVIGSDGEPLSQADWKVSVYPAGVGKPGKDHKARVTKQRDDLKKLVRSISDSLLLEGDVGELKGAFTPAVSQRLSRSRLGLPKGMTEVQTIRRSAKIGVDENAAHAAARITVAYTGDMEGRRIKMLHKLDLWLQRNSNGWRVIAFSGTAGQNR